MAVTLTNADKALKSFYLDVAKEQLDQNTNPFLAEIKKTTEDVWGKEIRKLAIYGVNGGIGAGTETGDLPEATGNNYENFVLSLKNLYGTIEISDKAVRASENNSGAFVNLLNAEMDGLIKASTFNFGRMLFGDGSGVLATVSKVENGVITLDSVKNIVEGMVVDFRDAFGNLIESAKQRKVLSVDRKNKTIAVGGVSVADEVVGATVCIQGSYQNELTGLKAIFDKEGSLYGLDRKSHTWLAPYIKEEQGEITEKAIQTALDTIEEQSGSQVNFIICSLGVRRALQEIFSKSNTRTDTMNLAGGYKAISYNGIPIIADRFCPEGTMYLLNTEDFALHQLCDWQWLEGEDGKVLSQIPGKPIYTATLVKYADLLCSKPCGQGMITGITEG
ncbi:MAG: phage major capsid protein [Clostridia bacterium]|nr:phage major capsid protein [Clostridia bacterium]